MPKSNLSHTHDPNPSLKPTLTLITWRQIYIPIFQVCTCIFPQFRPIFRYCSLYITTIRWKDAYNSRRKHVK